MACGLVALAAGPGYAATSEVIDRTALRVCADPANLPFSNQAGDGFENKIAELLAAELGLPLQYTWFPQATGFIRQTLRARKCDLVVGIASGNEMLQNTNSYYRSSYALIYRKDSGLSATGLDDPALPGRRIGVVAGTPPATLLAINGLLGNVQPYQLMVDTRFESPGKQMVDDVASGHIDLGVLWGPIAGYYARSHAPALVVVPLTTAAAGLRVDFRIGMGVRYGEPEWKRLINRLLGDRQKDIDAILRDYGVPLLDNRGEPIAP